MNKHNFKVGDRVLTLQLIHGRKETLGKTATIVHIYGNGSIALEFDENIKAHSCGGFAKGGHGFNLWLDTYTKAEDYIKLI